MRILHVNTTRTWRGGERQTLLLALEQRKQGDNPILAVRAGSVLESRASEEGLSTHRFRAVAGTAGHALALNRLIRVSRPDILHVHTARDHTLAWLAGALGSALPTVVHRRVDFPLRRNLFSRAKYHAQHIDRFIAVSHAVARELVRGGVPDHRVVTVYSAVPPPRRLSASARTRLAEHVGLDSGTVPIAVIGSLVNHKGHRYLLDAMPRILATMPTVRLLVIGDGPLSKALQRQAARLGVSRYVCFLGYLDDARDYLQIVRLLVVPSHLEGLNTTTLDAFQCRCPVVAATAGGVAELVTPQTGWPVAPRDPAALADAVLEALDDERACRRRAESAWDLVNTRHTVRVMAEATRRVYEEAIQRRQRRG